jgi:hypothetical protein
MAEWKPRTIRELLQPGYNDRFLWYATALGIGIAGLGVIAIVTGIISAVTSYIAMKVALESLALQNLQASIVGIFSQRYTEG